MEYLARARVTCQHPNIALGHVTAEEIRAFLAHRSNCLLWVPYGNQAEVAGTKKMSPSMTERLNKYTLKWKVE